jgi:transposase
MWLTGRLAPDHKTIADFRRENGAAIQAACAQFVVLCRQLGLFGAALVAIDGSKFKAVNTRDRNFTAYKVKRRIEQVAEHIAGYLQDRHGRPTGGEAAEARSGRAGREDRSTPRPDGDAEGHGGRGRVARRRSP